MLARLLLLVQTDVWHAVSPNFADGDGLKNPKSIPLTVTSTAPLMGNSTFKDAALRSDDVKAKADAGIMAFESSGDACQRTLIPTAPVLWLSSIVIAYQPKVTPAKNVPLLSVMPWTALLSTTQVLPIHSLDPSLLSVKNVHVPPNGMLMKPAIRITKLFDLVLAGLLGRQFEKNEGLSPVDGCGNRVQELGIRVPAVSPEDTEVLRSPDDDT